MSRPPATAVAKGSVARAARELDAALGRGAARSAPIAVALLAFARSLDKFINRSRPRASVKIMADQEVARYDRLCAAWHGVFGEAPASSLMAFAVGSQPNGGASARELGKAIDEIVKLRPLSGQSRVLGRFISRHQASAKGSRRLVMTGYRDHVALWRIHAEEGVAKTG